MIGRKYRVVITGILALYVFTVAEMSNRGDWMVPDTIADTVTSTRNHSGELPKLRKMVVRASQTRSSAGGIVVAEPEAVFTADDVVTTAGVAEDISRYIATLPQAVSSLGEHFDNALYVRGGRPSEVIFVVDGIEFENVNHFSRANSSGGPLGFINSNFVKNVSFFAGTTPAAYPSRLSSVVDVTMKAGSFTDRRHSLGCKLTGGMFSTEGPFGGGYGSYAVAGRYIDFSTLRRFVNDYGIPRLGDCYFKGVLAGNRSFDLSVTGLGSYNTFNFDCPVNEVSVDGTQEEHSTTKRERKRIVQGGTGITLRLRKGTWANRSTLSCSFRRGEDSDSLQEFDDPFFNRRYLENPIRREQDRRVRLTFSTTGTWKPDSTTTVSIGTRCGYHRYRFFTGDYRFTDGSNTVCTAQGPMAVPWSRRPRLRALTLTTGEVGGHLEYAVRRGLLSASLGVRADYHALLKKTGVSPRGTIGFDCGAAGKIRMSGDLQHQFPTDMPSLFFYFFSYDTTLSDDEAAITTRSFLRQLQPLRCFQTALSHIWEEISWLHLETGLYFKWYDREYHYVSPKIQEVFTYDERGQPILTEQNGRRKSFGVECMISGEYNGFFTYSAGGSLFDVKNRYRNGRWYDDWTNVRYTGALSLGCNLFKRHRMSVSARVHGGRPYCSEIIVADCIGRRSSVFEPGQQYYARRFDRLLATHVRYGYHRLIGPLDTEWFVEVINAFNNQPVLEYRFTGKEFQEIKPFGTMPIIGVTFTW